MEYGLLSVVPSLLALVLAILTRQVVFSLAASVVVGMTIIHGFNPLNGLIATVESGLFKQLAKGGNARVVIIICIIAGFVHLLERSGGMMAFARMAARKVVTPFKAQISVWIMGMVIFFTDSGNSLILGPLFRPIFNRLKVCREKLAFILDSTSSPICVLTPITSWGIFIMSQIDKAYKSINITEEPMTAWLGAWPFQFYAILAVISVPFFALTSKEFGPMAKAQARCSENECGEQPNEVSTGSNESNTPSSQDIQSNEPEVGARVVLMPLLSVFLVMGSMFAYLFMNHEGSGPLPGSKIQVALALAYLTGAFVCAGLIARAGKMTMGESFSIYLKGIGRVVMIILILLLAWSLGDVCRELDTGGFIASLFGDTMPGALVPAAIFLIGVCISMTTGSSWGTYAILMPIAIPVAAQLGAPIHVTIGAVLSGGMFGDHTSPISDTTILSSMASECVHAEHVNTQIPYAAVAGCVSLIAFVVSGYYPYGWIVIPAIVLQAVAVLTLMKVLGKKMINIL